MSSKICRLFLFLSTIIVFSAIFSSTSRSSAASYPYTIKSFSSNVYVNKDTSITVTENIKVEFLEPRHGIFRNIPVVYSARGKTINTDLRVQSVRNNLGTSYKYEVGRDGKQVQIKIGDPDTTVIGEVVYVIKYKMDWVLQAFAGQPELYWNVTGSNWDQSILSADVTVESPYAPIVQFACFAGKVGSRDRECVTLSSSQSSLSIKTTNPINPGSDFTIAVGFDKQNQLAYPGSVKKSIKLLRDNWGYPLAALPLIFIVSAWLWKGRDRRYFTKNIYYETDDKKEETVPVFAREHIPMVYSPIKDISPSEAGTLIDEKVDVKDVVGEILELARLGYIKIKIVGDKKGKEKYAFLKLKDADDGLQEHQSYLLDEIFEANICSNTIKTADKLFNKESTEYEEAVTLALQDKYVLLDAMKTKFYTSLNSYKDILYKNLSQESLFSGNPESVRNGWGVVFYILAFVAFSSLLSFGEDTGNFYPLLFVIISFIVGFFFVRSMPRRTAKGYSLYRQVEGLKYFVNKGQWRHKIAEKHLFIEEILPLAVSLGIVGKLAKDMQDLGMEPPSYMSGFAAANIASSISSFEKITASSVSSTPGGGKWSGGSGFSGGGSSGGGFGGGGGGSW